MSTLGQPQRQHRILRMLEDQPVSSQAQLVQMLEAEGIVATQATVSRDLEELGAVKVRIPGGAMAYAIPEFTRERAPSDDHLKRLMGEFVVEVSHSANLVVLRTPPGSAHVVASALDRASLGDRCSARSRATTPCSSCARNRLGGGGRRRRARRPRRSLSRRRIIVPKRVVLAYSGGLDTSVAVRWMREEWGVEVDRVRGRCRPARPRRGGHRSASGPRPPARSRSRSSTPASSSHATSSCPALRANALYEGKYPLVSALSRPVIVEHLVASARRHGADAVGHGCTGKGNDQVRFEVSSRILAPDLDVMAPVRVWGLTRADCIELADKWDIPISASKEKLYSIDENMWGRAIECGVLENPWSAAPEEPYTLTAHAKDAPSELDARSSSAFERGVPVVARRRGGRPRRADRDARPHGRRLRLGPYRHGREPAGRHQEPRGVRVPGVARADPRAQGSRRDHARARSRAGEAAPRDPGRRADLRRHVARPAHGCARRVRRRRRKST